MRSAGVTVGQSSQNGVIYTAFDVIFSWGFFSCFFFVLNYVIIPNFWRRHCVPSHLEQSTRAIEACLLNGVKAVEIARLFGVSDMMF